MCSKRQLTDVVPTCPLRCMCSKSTWCLPVLGTSCRHRDTPVRSWRSGPCCRGTRIVYACPRLPTRAPVAREHELFTHALGCEHVHLLLGNTNCLRMPSAAKTCTCYRGTQIVYACSRLPTRTPARSRE